MPIKKRSPISRRDFIAGAVGVVAGATLTRGRLPFLPRQIAPIPGSILGAPFKTGHLLRDGKFPAFSETRETDVLIVGGGIAGLSAAWWLRKNRLTDFQLLEMDEEVGGNARWGKNAVSAYPWGAHYVPIPTAESALMMELFEELGVIEGRSESGLPIYNELYLSNDPLERVFAAGRWQEGLIPKSELTESDRIQFEKFFAEMARFRTSVGADGKRLFAIPLEESSISPETRALDLISMSDFLKSRGYDSPRLSWYVDYCTRDDYGAGLERISAWAGVHYFASRDGKGANTVRGNVLTWPEGNGWLVEKLKERVSGHVQSSMLVFHVESGTAGAYADALDVRTGKTIRYRAKAVVFAGPRFVATRVVAPLIQDPPEYLSRLEYSPWMVANLTVDSRPQDSKRGAPLCWDNVIYRSPALGYVNAGNQKIERYPRETVLTYYWPLSHTDPVSARKEALSKNHSEWVRLIFEDLAEAHPDLDEQVSRVDVWVWGHGMIRPTPGYIWGEQRKKMLESVGRIFFAHTDMSGISIFEEAQYRGVQAATLALQQIRKKSRSSDA